MERIKKVLTSRVQSELENMAKERPDDYRRFWHEFGVFIKEGVATEVGGRDDLLKLLRFHSTKTQGDELTSFQYLRTLAVSLAPSLALAPAIPDDVVAVAESGIRAGRDVAALRAAGFDAFLVGEHLMSAPDPGAALLRLIQEAEAA